MPRIKMTDEIARAAAADEANASMRAGGRTAWSREDYNRAVAAYDRLNPLPKGHYRVSSGGDLGVMKYRTREEAIVGANSGVRWGTGPMEVVFIEDPDERLITVDEDEERRRGSKPIRVRGSSRARRHRRSRPRR